MKDLTEKVFSEIDRLTEKYTELLEISAEETKNDTLFLRGKLII